MEAVAAAERGEPERFFGVVADRFEAAARAVGGADDRHYRIAGCNVRLRFAGPALTSMLTPALEHLAVERSSDEASGPGRTLTVCLWDSASTGTSMPKAPWVWDTVSFRSEVPGYNTDRMLTVFDIGARALNLLDRQEDRAVYWVRDAAPIPAWETAAPLRAILNNWLATQGVQVVHSAAVGTSEGGALLVGEGGSGKSTTALACLESPLTYAGDDYCAFSTDPEPWAHSLYATAKADAKTLAALPGLAGITNVETSPDEKAILLLREKYDDKIVSGFPLRAVLLPHVEDRVDTEATAVSSGEALRALAPSTIQQLAGAGNEAWLRMSRLVRQVPCYRLHLGSDRARIPGVIQRLLEP